MQAHALKRIARAVTNRFWQPARPSSIQTATRCWANELTLNREERTKLAATKDAAAL